MLSAVAMSLLFKTHKVFFMLPFTMKSRSFGSFKIFLFLYVMANSYEIYEEIMILISYFFREILTSAVF